MFYSEKMNAFTCYLQGNWRYKITHPLRTIKAIFKGFRAAWHRATRGYSNYDLWDFDSWLLQLLPNALDDFVKDNQGYPCAGDNDTFEKWQEFLTQLATDLRNCQDAEADDRNEYYKEYMAHICDHEDHEGITKLYLARCDELCKEQQHNLEVAFDKLAKNLRLIWW